MERLAVILLQDPFALDDVAVVFPELELDDKIKSSSSSADDELEHALSPKARAVQIPSFQKTDFFIKTPLEKFYLR